MSDSKNANNANSPAFATTCDSPALVSSSLSPDSLPKLSRYTCIEQIGKGGMGVVLRARDPRLEREIAIKVVRTVVDQEIVIEKKLAERFVAEARAIAKIKHPHVVSIYDSEFREDQSEFYIVMELLGKDVATLIKEEKAKGCAIWPIKLDTAIKITRDTACGLGAAHLEGQVHRDVKPANLLFDEQGNAKLGDFGLTKRIELSKGRRQSIVGTPAYMPPEQAKNGTLVDQRSDLYSLGAVFYQLLTGDVPYPQGSSLDETLEAHVKMAVPKVMGKRPDIDILILDQIDGIIAKAMAKNPNDRFQTAMEFMSALDQLKSALVPKPPEPKIWQQYPVAFFGFLALAVLMLISLVLLANRKGVVKPDPMQIFAADVAAISEPATRVAKVLAELKRYNPALDLNSVKVLASQTHYGETGYSLIFEPRSEITNWGPIGALRSDLVCLVAPNCHLDSTESVAALAECRRLKVLDLSYTGELKSLKQLSALNLAELYIRDTGVDSLEFLRGKTSLKVLVAINCPLQFKDFQPLDGEGLSKLAISLQGPDRQELGKALPKVELIDF